MKITPLETLGFGLGLFAGFLVGHLYTIYAITNIPIGH